MADKYFPEKPDLSPSIYAYTLQWVAQRQWQIKVWYTTQDVRSRIDQQTKTAWVQYDVVLEESAMRTDGSSFKDHDIHIQLSKMWCRRTQGEWFVCTVDDIHKAIYAVKHRTEIAQERTEDFSMRPEQTAAVEKTIHYYRSYISENTHKSPHFLWNAKMRFGKTFASYQLAIAMWRSKVLVLTFKPAVENSRHEDLMSHVDFEWWQFVSRNYTSFENIDTSRPFVCFGSFQDYLGKNSAWWIKAKNERVHVTHRDAVIFDEYHYGAWRDRAKWLTGEDLDADQEAIEKETKGEVDAIAQSAFAEWIHQAEEIMPITTDHYLYLSWTPFRAIWSGEFIEEQIFNRTYSDEQREKENRKWDKNPYDLLPKMVMMTYQMPESITSIAQWWEYDEFDLNTFFKAEWECDSAIFVHQEYVQKRLDLIRGSYLETSLDNLKMWAKKPAFPFSDVRLLSLLTHTFRYLPSVASCYAMKNLMHQRQNSFYHDYAVIVAAWTRAGIWAKALWPVQEAMWDPLKTKTITLSTGKLTTWVSVKPRSGVLMLRNLKSPETYFQTAFRAQTPWVIYNPDGKSPNQKEIIKKVCYVFDFAPNRALSQIADYSNKLDPEETNPEKKVADFIKFLPVLAYDGSAMKEIDAIEILDIVTSWTTATLLARRWESALLVNVDNDTLARLMANQQAMDVLMSIEWFRSLNQDIETIINKSESVKKAKQEANEQELTKKQKKKLSDEEKEYKSKRKEIQNKLIKFATRIPVFMYLTDYREHSLKDVITQLEPNLFKKVTWLSVQDFELLVSLNIFNDALMNDAVYKFKRYEDASLEYAWINRHKWERVWWYDWTISEEEYKWM